MRICWAGVGEGDVSCGELGWGRQRESLGMTGTGWKRGKAFTGSHVVETLVRRLGLAVELGFGASEFALCCHLVSGLGEGGGSGSPQSSGWIFQALGFGEPQALDGSGCSAVMAVGPDSDHVGDFGRPLCNQALMENSHLQGACPALPHSDPPSSGSSPGATSHMCVPAPLLVS